MADDFYTDSDLFFEASIPAEMNAVEALKLRMAFHEAAMRSQPLPIIDSLRSGLVLGIVEGGVIGPHGLDVHGRIESYAEPPWTPYSKALRSIASGRWQRAELITGTTGGRLDLVAVQVGPQGSGQAQVVPVPVRRQLERDLDTASVTLSVAEMARRFRSMR